MARSCLYVFLSAIWLALNIAFVGTGIGLLVQYFSLAQNSGDCGQLWGFVLSHAALNFITFIFVVKRFYPCSVLFKQMSLSLQFVGSFAFLIWGGVVLDAGTCRSSGYMWQYLHATLWLSMIQVIGWLLFGLFSVCVTDVSSRRTAKEYLLDDDDGYDDIQALRIANGGSCGCFSRCWREHQARNQAAEVQKQVQAALGSQQAVLNAAVAQAVAQAQAAQNRV